MKIWFAGNPVDSDEKHVLEVGGETSTLFFLREGLFSSIYSKVGKEDKC